MCLAQGHNAVTQVGLEIAALRSRVKHSTTEPLRSLPCFDDYHSTYANPENFVIIGGSALTPFFSHHLKMDPIAFPCLQVRAAPLDPHMT